MKLLIYTTLLSVLFYLSACGNSKKNISGIVVNAENKYLVLKISDEGKLKTIDSIKLTKKGNFNFVIDKEKPSFYFLLLDKQYTGLVLDKTDNIEITADGNDLFATIKVKNSKRNEDLINFFKTLDPTFKRYAALDRELNIGNTADSTLNQKAQELITLKKELEKNSIDFINLYKNDIVSFYGLNFLTDTSHYTYYKTVASTLEKNNKNTLEYMRVNSILQQLDAIRNQDREMAFLNPGNKVPEITLPDVNGKNLSLTSLKGKVVLIDFWASWCGPCRKENPNVVAAYAKFKNKGFTVYSVSLDDAAKGGLEAWKQAIKKDGLIWPNHVSDLKGWNSSVVPQFKIQGIPFTLLIDKDGTILAKNLRGSALDEKLEEILNK